MDVDSWKTVLLTRYHYSDYAAEQTAQRIGQMDEDCREALQNWLDTDEMPELVCGEFSVAGLLAEYHLKPPAACLTISDLRHDYAQVAAFLKQGFK